ncbi:MAG: cytochrome c [Ignavibacteria bacterium]
MAHGTGKKKFNVFDLFRDLAKFYGILYMLLLGFITYLGVKYVETLDYNKLYHAPVLLSADSNMRVSQPLKRGGITPPVDVIKFSTPNPDLISKGKDLYNTNCVSCHGETGAGNGPAGATLVPPPRNFIDPSKQVWKNGPKISNMYVTLQEGIPNTGMASFSTIPPEDRFAIIQYVQTFNPTYPKDTPDSLAALDAKYSLAKGYKMPNQIPLGLAMDLEVLDYDTVSANLNSVISNLQNEKIDSASIIFNEIVSDKMKVLNSFAANVKWNENIDEFVQFIETDPIDKGFKGSVYQLSPEKTNLLYNYLKNLFSKNRV